jgi:hypothetical protein
MVMNNDNRLLYGLGGRCETLANIAAVDPCFEPDWLVGLIQPGLKRFDCQPNLSFFPGNKFCSLSNHPVSMGHSVQCDLKSKVVGFRKRKSQSSGANRRLRRMEFPGMGM